MEPTDYRKLAGSQGEQAAYDFLIAKGYVCRERNFRLRGGEIDLIMDDGAYLVFVEVKFRRSLDYGAPEEAVTAAKIKRMTKAALTYIVQNRLADRGVRFDVIAVDLEGVHHLPNAFETSGKYYF
jgi:putative endonuclease